MIQPSMFPIATFQECSVDDANELLVAWQHKMGPILRPMDGFESGHVLMRGAEPIAVTTSSSLIREGVGGGLREILTRANTVELSRLCAAAPAFNRVMLRMWREFVFPALGVPFAISYQDADIHNGNTYRFDGWLRLTFSRAGGVDRRSGKPGRNKWVWGWPAEPLRALLSETGFQETARTTNGTPPGVSYAQIRVPE